MSSEVEHRELNAVAVELRALQRGLELRKTDLSLGELRLVLIVFIEVEIALIEKLKAVRCSHVMAGTDERCWLASGHAGVHQRSPEPNQEWG